MLFKGIKKLSGPLFFLLGCFLLLNLVHRFGVAEFFQTFHRLGYWMSFILALPLTWYVAQTAGWLLTVEETGKHVSFYELLKIKLAGEAVNTLTPFSFMGGDPIRMLMLQKKMSGTLSTASIVLDRTMQSLAVVVFIFFGLIAALFTLDLPRSWVIAFPLLLLGMVILLWFFMRHQTRGLFECISKIMSFFGFSWHHTQHIQQKMRNVDERISHFYRRHRSWFVLVLLLHFIGRLLGVVEIYLISHFLSIPLGWEGSLFLATLSILVNIVFVFIPGSMGVMEGAYGVLFHLMGFNPALGVAVQLVRRARTIFWIFVGILFVLPYLLIYRRANA